jgi:hypothetical protein
MVTRRLVAAIAGKDREMAQAQVTMKVSPNELQVISEALRMYAFAMRRIKREDVKHPLDEFKVDLSVGGDHRKLSMAADKIRQDIGLK